MLSMARGISVDQFDQIKAALDKQLESASPNVGIAFGVELFNEFKKREWFTLETFGALGSLFGAHQVPAYNKTHFVFQTWNIEDLEFKVGTST
jgi:hypothetical protein